MTGAGPGLAPFSDWERTLAEGRFEEVYETLEAVVGFLDEGRLPLEESVECFEIGVRLAQRCEAILAEAELRVTRLDETWDRPDLPEKETLDA